MKEVKTIPNPLAIEADHEANGNELMSIDVLHKPSFSTSGKDCLRVGAAVTNEAFRRWAIRNKKCALPMDVILVEYASQCFMEDRAKVACRVTVGGVNGPICHGAGRSHKTINDQVVAIEYVRFADET